MKNFILSLLTFAAFNATFAQSIEVTSDLPIPAMSTLDLNNTLDFKDFHVKNISSQSVDVRINRVVNNITAGHETYFCWEYCYDSGTSISGGASAGGIAIAPGASIDNFTFHVNANGVEGCGHVVVHFFNKKNANDYVEKVFDYCTLNGTTLSIANEVNASKVLSAPMPNPASDVAVIKVDLPRSTENTYLLVSDLAGKEMSRIAVNQPTSMLTIPTENLNAGLYYLSLVAEGSVLATQKLLVNH